MAITAKRPSQYLMRLVDALGGSWHGYSAMCRCPAHNDREPSLSIRQGDRDVLVTCFAGCHPADILRELKRVPLGRCFEAPLPQQATGTANIDRLWSEAVDVAGTLGERYLASRFLLPLPGDVRFHPRCPLGKRPLTVFKPALLVGVREGGRLVAFQRIFLRPDGRGYTQKATLGALGTGAWDEGMSGATTGLAEGFETARAWSKLHGLPCKASLGSRRLDLIALSENVTHLILVGDNDLAGRRAVSRSIKRYATAQRIVVPNFPPRGFKDWAEVLAVKEGGGAGR